VALPVAMGGGAAAVPWAVTEEKKCRGDVGEEWRCPPDLEEQLDEAKLLGDLLKKVGNSPKKLGPPAPECTGGPPSRPGSPSSKVSMKFQSGLETEERQQPSRLKPGDVAALRASAKVLISAANEDVSSNAEFIARAPRLCREAQQMQEQARRDLNRSRGAQVRATGLYQSYVDLITKAEHVLRRLQEARYARATDASICSARLAQLAQLPAPEASEHGSMEEVEQHLQSEQDALEQARNLLLAREEQLRQFMDVLGNAQSSLTKEGPARRLLVRRGLRGLRCDNLLDGDTPFPDRPKTSAASAPCSPRGCTKPARQLSASFSIDRTFCHAGQQKEVDDDEDPAMELALRRVQQHQARTFELCGQAHDTIQSTANSCASHASRTSAALKACASERAYLRAGLEEDLRRIDQATRSERWLLRRTPKWAEHQTRLDRSQQLLTDLSSTHAALQQHLWHAREEQRLAEECLKLTPVTAVHTMAPATFRNKYVAGAAGRCLRRTRSASAMLSPGGASRRADSNSKIRREHHS